MQDSKEPQIVDDRDGLIDGSGVAVTDLIELPVEVLDEVSGGAGNAAIDF